MFSDRVADAVLELFGDDMVEEELEGRDYI